MALEKPPVNYEKTSKNEILISNALVIAVETNKNKNKNFSYFVIIVYNINSTHRL